MKVIENTRYGSRIAAISTTSTKQMEKNCWSGNGKGSSLREKFAFSGVYFVERFEP
jgi:hypothetical protein